MGPRLIPTQGPIDLKKYSVWSSHQGLSTFQISSRLVEKWWRNRGSQVAVKKNKKEEKKNNNKKQNKNRKVFRLCRQTLKTESPVKLREKILNFTVKLRKNYKFCRALAQFCGKTSCISWRHNGFSQVFAATVEMLAILGRLNNGKMDERNRSHVILNLKLLQATAEMFGHFPPIPRKFRSDYWFLF